VGAAGGGPGSSAAGADAAGAAASSSALPGGGSGGLPTLTLVVRSAEDLLQCHRAEPARLPASSNGSSATAGLLGSVLGQLLRRAADLRPCDLRHQAAAHEDDEEDLKEEEEGGENAVNDTEEVKDCLWELQPRGLRVLLVDSSGRRLCSPRDGHAECGAAGQAALWRALLFAACRDAQDGPMPLLRSSAKAAAAGSAAASAAAGAGPSCLLAISPDFMRGRQKERHGWYFGLGLVLGLALRTSVRLPLRLAPSLWAALAAAAATATTTGTPHATASAEAAAARHATAAAVAAVASGLCAVVPRDALALLGGADLEAFLALPHVANDAVVAAWAQE
jgi:hypothetical protein